MAFLFEQGSFIKETSGVAGATQSVPLNNSAFTPKALILWCSQQPVEGFSSSLSYSMGAGTSTALANQRSSAWFSGDSVSTSDPALRYGDDVLAVLTSGVPAVGVVGRINGFTAGAFQLIYPTNSTVAYLIHYVVLGGDDLTNALLIEKSSPTVTGNRDDTGFGFQPDFVLFPASQGAASAPPIANGAAIQTALGVAGSSSARWAIALAGGASGTTAGIGAVNDLDTTKCFHILNAGVAAPTINIAADFVAFIADGYTLNWTSVAASARRYGVLALKGGRYAVGAFSKTTGSSGSTNDVTAPGFAPVGVLQATVDRLSGDGVGEDCEFAMGGYDGVREGHAWGEFLDNTLPTEANRKIDSTKVISTNIGPSTVKAEADCSFIVGGFRDTWSTNDAVATEIAWIAFGDAAVAGGSGTLTLPLLRVGQ